MIGGPSGEWEWQKMEVKAKENGAPHLAFHPACKVKVATVLIDAYFYSVTIFKRLFGIHKVNCTCSPSVQRLMNLTPKLHQNSHFCYFNHVNLFQPNL